MHCLTEFSKISLTNINFHFVEVVKKNKYEAIETSNGNNGLLVISPLLNSVKFPFYRLYFKPIPPDHPLPFVATTLTKPAICAPQPDRKINQIKLSLPIRELNQRHYSLTSIVPLFTSGYDSCFPTFSIVFQALTPSPHECSNVTCI